MILFRHELRRGFKSLMIWTVTVCLMILVCVVIYPEFKDGMVDMAETFSSMGAFSAAFGVDKMNLGTLIGYYALECGNILGLGGAVFAALLGISALAKEEADGTAEFLLTHPISRTRYMWEKLAAVLAQVLILNLAVALTSALAIAAIGEEWPDKLTLVHLMFLLMHIEIAVLSVGLSSVTKNSYMGMGIGASMLMYFANLIANMTESMEFLKYFTPFAYSDGSQVVSSGVNWTYLSIGYLCAAFVLAGGFRKYRKKDIV